MATRKIWKTVAEPTHAERTFPSEKAARAHLETLRSRVEQGLVKTVQSLTITVSADRGQTWTHVEHADLRDSVTL